MLKYENAGFTILEIIVVIAMVSVLAGISIPRFGTVVESFRATEGDQILLALLAAQERIRLDTGNYTNVLNDLDIDIIGRPLDNFNLPTVDNDINNLAEIDRSSGSPYDYVLNIDANANITCTGGAAGVCSKLGYPKN